jgi:CheY-like chemotaxis protein
VTTETILLADDEPAVLMLAERLLGQSGYRVLTVRDGEEALAVYRRHADEIALVITDLRMPKLDGLELLRQLKQLNQDVKVLVVTGSPVSELAAAAMAEGAEEMLAKPYHIADLVKTVRRMLCREDKLTMSTCW